MENPFKYSFDNKGYHTLNYYLKSRYGKKLYKAVIDCGMTCPNIDGTRGFGGCIFCDGGSGYFTQKNISVTEQLELEVERIREKNGDVPIVAYFQANTNTYAPVDKLRQIYNEALRFPDISGISIGTRADCLPNDVLELLCEINSCTELTVELGMQTVHEKTIDKIVDIYEYPDVFISEFSEEFLEIPEIIIKTSICVISNRIII